MWGEKKPSYVSASIRHFYEKFTNKKGTQYSFYINRAALNSEENCFWNKQNRILILSNPKKMSNGRIIFWIIFWPGFIKIGGKKISSKNFQLRH